eukprot:c10181_g1_i2.p1 GENE.c10181_g1_i2~~c10181_g1_i2.p1  ORF type:complete len:118 (-),score=18.73 c10181_g1_i2:134-487(-)
MWYAEMELHPRPHSRSATSPRGEINPTHTNTSVTTKAEFAKTNKLELFGSNFLNSTCPRTSINSPGTYTRGPRNNSSASSILHAALNVRDLVVVLFKFRAPVILWLGKQMGTEEPER